MSNNKRAMQFKANAEEYDQKLSDIKRLVGTLERFVNDTVRSVQYHDWIQKPLHIIPLTISGCLVVRAYHNSFENDRKPFKFLLWNGATQLEKDEQFDLATVRLLHDNLDSLIEYAKEICRCAGRTSEFRAAMARFGM
jgi:hypothetical protein